jgi:hypothetical protein
MPKSVIAVLFIGGCSATHLLAGEEPLPDANWVYK